LPRGRWQVARLLARCHSGPFWKQLPQALGRHWYLCTLSDGIAAEVCFAGQYEAQETLMLRATLKPGDVFVDVGANWGYFSLIGAGLVGNSGRVVCLEPHPLLFRQLRQNIERNALSQVLPICAAACDRFRELVLEGVVMGSGNSGGSRVVEKPGPGSRAYSVRGVPVDAVLDRCGLGTVACLKMDIEGGEACAMRGLRGLRSGRYRRILLEVHPSHLHAQGLSVADVFLPLTRAGYEGWVIDHAPSATRRAAALKPHEAASLLTPFDKAGSPDSWRNMLWTAPGVKSS
jgi:FkbM family methyltransferase